MPIKVFTVRMLPPASISSKVGMGVCVADVDLFRSKRSAIVGTDIVRYCRRTRSIGLCWSLD